MRQQTSKMEYNLDSPNSVREAHIRVLSFPKCQKRHYRCSLGVLIKGVLFNSNRGRVPTYFHAFSSLLLVPPSSFLPSLVSHSMPAPVRTRSSSKGDSILLPQPPKQRNSCDQIYDGKSWARLDFIQFTQVSLKRSVQPSCPS